MDGFFFYFFLYLAIAYAAGVLSGLAIWRLWAWLR